MTEISALTEKATADSTDLFVIETAAGVLQKMQHSTVISDEATTREANDDAIIVGSGLDADGSFPDLNTAKYIDPASFTTAGYVQSGTNALKLLDTAIQLVDAKVNLIEVVVVTSAELLDIKDAPKTLIQAPAAGVFINPIELIAQYNKGTADYTHIENPLMIVYEGANKALITLSRGFLTSGNKIEKATYSCSENMETATAIQLYAGTEPTGGDGTVSLRIKYELVGTSDFSTPTINATCCTLSTTGTFINEDLVDGALTVTHSFNTSAVHVTVINDSGAVEYASWALGDAGGNDKTNKVTINIREISGTWRYVILADNPAL